MLGKALNVPKSMADQRGNHVLLSADASGAAVIQWV